MRLRRVEATSYGLLKNCTLGELGDGLTVVLGPNESGKSTFRTLVRHIFYGFPDGRSTDVGYRPPDGSVRSGRLVFQDDGAIYGLSRSGDSRGGAVRVEAISGPDRPLLLDDIVGRVSDHTYRVVFCFGLDELSAIETGSDKDVVSRLFAGVSGLGVNPMDVRAKLDSSATDIFKVRGRTGKLHETLSAIKEQRSELGELETQARDYSSAQKRLKALGERMAVLMAERDAADAKLHEMSTALVTAKGLEEQINDQVEQCEGMLARAEAADRDAKNNKVDERILEIEPELSVLLDEASAAKQHAEHARSLEARAAELQRKADALDVPADLHPGSAEKAMLDSWRGRKARLEAEAEAAGRAAEDSEAEAAGLEASQDQQAKAGAKRGVSAGVVAGLLLLTLGLAGVAGGLVMGQYIAAAIGGVAMLSAIVVLILGRGATTRSTLGEEMLRARAKAEKDRLLAANAYERLVEAIAEWEKWISGAGLAGRGAEVAAVESLIDAARKRDDLMDQISSLELEAAEDLRVAEGWRVALTDLVRGPFGIAEAHPEPQALAIRARDTLQRVRATRDAHDVAIKTAEAALADHAAGLKRLERLRAQLAEIAAQYSIEGSPALKLEAAKMAASDELAEAKRIFQEIASEHDELKGQLRTQGLDATMALTRQSIEGLMSRAQSEADEYLVEALAVALVDRARERYERDRQPEVVRTAQSVFAAMTDGRYKGVKVPLDKNAIEVISSNDETRLTSQLSRGTAEQLYLALRVGLIHSFGELAPDLPVLMDDIAVNYDQTRIGGAVAAVAALASERQVVFFTCHESTADALVAGVSGASLIKLERCALGGGFSG